MSVHSSTFGKIQIMSNSWKFSIEGYTYFSQALCNGVHLFPEKPLNCFLGKISINDSSRTNDAITVINRNNREVIGATRFAAHAHPRNSVFCWWTVPLTQRFTDNDKFRYEGRFLFNFHLLALFLQKKKKTVINHFTFCLGVLYLSKQNLT